MEGLSKYTLVAQASVEFPPPPRATVSFLPTPAFPPGTHATLRPSSSWSRYPVLALSRTSKPLESSRIIQTKTLQAPLASFAAPQVRNAPSRTEPPVEFGEDCGLLCLERVIPDEISRRLGRLAKAFAPFKVEAYRGGLLDTTQHWLDTLIEPFLAGSISSSYFRDPGQHQRALNSDMMPRAERNVLSEELNSEELAEPIEDAVIWLRDDISNVAKLFAQEVAGWLASWPGFDMTVEGKEGGEIGLTVKLELLRKGKCPRYHLDKVPLRLICTYLGPSTEWLDTYDGWEMHNNRSPPPACNLKISGGVEARRANEGDVLIFRGQPPQSTEPVGVAHCSPDMEEGQRRLVLTIDIGDTTCGSGATTVATSEKMNRSPVRIFVRNISRNHPGVILKKAKRPAPQQGRPSLSRSQRGSPFTIKEPRRKAEKTFTETGYRPHTQ